MSRLSSSQTAMLEGSIWKGLISFTIPIFLGNLFQQMYNAVDSLIVGNYLGKEALAKAFQLTHELRLRGLAADCDHMSRSMKAQFKYADKTGCRYVVIMGEDELAQGMAKVRDMRESTEEMIQLDALVETLASK